MRGYFISFVNKLINSPVYLEVRRINVGFVELIKDIENFEDTKVFNNSNFTNEVNLFKKMIKNI